MEILLEWRMVNYNFLGGWVLSKLSYYECARGLRCITLGYHLHHFLLNQLNLTCSFQKMQFLKRWKLGHYYLYKEEISM